MPGDDVQTQDSVNNDFTGVTVETFHNEDSEWKYSPPPDNQREFEFPEDGLSFSSRFDSGNLIQVERLGPYRYTMYTAPDCGNSPHQTNNRQWFHFAIRGGSRGCVISFTFVGMMHSKMFTYNWMPVTAVCPSRPQYSRLPGRALVVPMDFMPPTPGYPDFVYKPWKKNATGGAGVELDAAGNAASSPVGSPLGGTTEADGSGDGSPDALDVPTATTAARKKKDTSVAMNVSFDLRLETDASLTSAYPLGHPMCQATYVASNHPYAYATLQQNIVAWRQTVCGGVNSGDMDESFTPACYPSSVYLHHEILCKSLDGRNVDLLTITDRSGITNERSSFYNAQCDIPYSSATQEIKRPHLFVGKQYVVLSARVHPGECPSSHMMHGCIEFLLHSNDPRAIALRSRFIFLLVPMINPDGVVRGHSRADTEGVNLNRMYKNPSKSRHPAPYAIRRMLHCIASVKGRLALFIDMHAHANKRGTFFYGNSMDPTELLQGLLYAKLVSLNTPYFEFQSSNFSEANMFATGKTGEGRDNSSRVTLYQETGLVYSYTIEASHVMGNTLNSLVGLSSYPVEEPEVLQGTPCPRYTPAIFADIARGLLVSLLDLKNCNPLSRIPSTLYHSTKGVLVGLQRQIQVEVAERLFKLAFMNGGQAILAREGGGGMDPLTAVMSVLRVEDVPSTMTIKDARGLPSVTIRNVAEFLPLDQALQLLAHTLPTCPPRTLVCGSGRRAVLLTASSLGTTGRRSLSNAAGAGGVATGNTTRKSVSVTHRSTSS